MMIEKERGKGKKGGKTARKKNGRGEDSLNRQQFYKGRVPFP